MTALNHPWISQAVSNWWFVIKGITDRMRDNTVRYYSPLIYPWRLKEAPKADPNYLQVVSFYMYLMEVKMSEDGFYPQLFLPLGAFQQRPTRLIVRLYCWATSDSERWYVTEGIRLPCQKYPGANCSYDLCMICPTTSHTSGSLSRE